MKKPLPKWPLYLGLFVLYWLHNDLWFWHDPSLVLGLPVGLLYHIGFCAAASVMMFLLVNNAWPRHLKVKERGEQNS
ncbi:MAG: hypothetical protein ONA90_01560 [candidate division KSB1 bacterium]|nr:hypothetical protein [candidate division KSB1 bacterium]